MHSRVEACCYDLLDVQLQNKWNIFYCIFIFLVYNGFTHTQLYFFVTELPAEEGESHVYSGFNVILSMDQNALSFQPQERRFA